METADTQSLVDHDVRFPNEPSRFTVDTVDQLLEHCGNLAVSDITFQTDEPVFAELHGRLHKITRHKLSQNEMTDILNAMYGANGLTQLMSGKDVDTHYEVRPNRYDRYRYRINGTACLVGGHTGVQITARTIPSTPPDLADLALPQDLQDALTPDQGVVYVTGATGSGKSTLLAAIIKDIVQQEDSNRKVLTYESPIEFVFDSVEKPSAVVSQSEIPKHLPSFASGVRNALRRKPRLILVGECRDQETMSAVLEAAMTGHPVYTTLHSNGVAETVRRLVSSFPGEERDSRAIDIVETLRVVVWQQLVPTVDGKRIPLREYLIFNEKIRDLLLDSNLDNITSTTRQLVREYGQTMDVDARKHFEDGLISERQFNLICKESLS